jgi:hypothetical protein
MSGLGAAPRGLAHPLLWPRAHSVGLIDAPKMGKRLAKRDVQPDLILSSPAMRAHDGGDHRQEARLQARGYRGR